MSPPEKSISWYAEATPLGGGGEVESGIMAAVHMFRMITAVPGRQRKKYQISASSFMGEKMRFHLKFLYYFPGMRSIYRG